ncbi:hypothetical protein OAS89_05945 [Alphaproteobacteria bacterium]|nr:hypothetical protein [Alphaproteobacteria bacterium]
MKFKLVIIAVIAFGLSGCNQAFMGGMAQGLNKSISGQPSGDSQALAAQRTTCIMNGGIWLATGGCMY